MRLPFVAIVVTAMAAQAAETRLSWSVAGEFCGNPKWSPGGKQVVCSDGAIYEAGRRVTKITNGFRPVISRDGHMAYLVYSEQYNELWVRRAGRHHSEKVPGTTAVMRLAWSPDGRWLAVTVRCDGRSCVDVVDLRHRGQGSRRLAHRVREFAWSPDSAHLAILRDIGNRKRPGIDLDRLDVARVAIADGATETLLEPKGEWCTYQALAWAPGGLLVTHRCFPEGTSGAGNNELQVYEVR